MSKSVPPSNCFFLPSPCIVALSGWGKGVGYVAERTVWLRLGIRFREGGSFYL